MNKIKSTLIMVVLVFLGVLALSIAIFFLGIILSFMMEAAGEFVSGKSGMKLGIVIFFIIAILVYELYL